MARTELRNSPAAVAENKAQELSGKVARKVSEILEEASQREKTPQPVLAYSVPAPGVRYYF